MIDVLIIASIAVLGTGVLYYGKEIVEQLIYSNYLKEQIIARMDEVNDNKEVIED